MGLRFIIIGLAALFIVAAVGGYFYFQERQITRLEDKITEQQEQIAGLTLDNEKLKASNESLQNEIDRRVTEAREIREELDRLREADSSSRSRLAEIQKQLRDYERQSRIARIRESSKASLLLRLINKNVRCYIENFDRFDGKCINGKFVVDGERFVPETTGEDNNENE